MTRPVLSSWKEIADYLGKGVRTVQRWEAKASLPIHRPTPGVILAYPEELNAWAHAGHDENQREVHTALAELTRVRAEKEQLSREIAELKAQRNSLIQPPFQATTPAESRPKPSIEQLCSSSKAARRKTFELIEWSLDIALRVTQKQKLRFVTVALGVAATYCSLAEAPVARSRSDKRKHFVEVVRSELAAADHVLQTSMKDFGAAGPELLRRRDELLQRVQQVEAALELPLKPQPRLLPYSVSIARNTLAQTLKNTLRQIEREQQQEPNSYAMHDLKRRLLFNLADVQRWTHDPAADSDTSNSAPTPPLDPSN